MGVDGGLDGVAAFGAEVGREAGAEVVVAVDAGEVGGDGEGGHGE